MKPNLKEDKTTWASTVTLEHSYINCTVNWAITARLLHRRTGGNLSVVEPYGPVSREKAARLQN